MSLAEVHDISEFNLADVPNRLRMLADELEQRGSAIRACVCVIDFTHEPIDIASFGRDGDQMRAIGLLTTASACLTTSIIEYGRQDGRDPEPAA